MLRLSSFVRIVIVLLFCLISVALSQASAAERGYCDRAFNTERLSSDARKRLNRGETVLEIKTNADSAFNTIYGLRLMQADAELAMAVMSSFEEEKNHLSAIIESTVEARKKNFARARFEVYIDHPLIPNTHFTANIYTTKDAGGAYTQRWSLASSTGFSRLEYVDGFARTLDYGAGSLLVYCSYSVPALKIYADYTNEMSARSLKRSLDEMGEWVDDVARDPAALTSYLRTFRGTLE